MKNRTENQGRGENVQNEQWHVSRPIIAKLALDTFFSRSTAGAKQNRA